jgi:hypothetical protein
MTRTCTGRWLTAPAIVTELSAEATGCKSFERSAARRYKQGANRGARCAATDGSNFATAVAGRLM